VGTIICGVSASDEARSAAKLAAALADEFGAELVLVHAVDLPEIAADSLTASRDRAEAERMLATLERELAADAETVVVMGKPSEAIAAVAETVGASLLVVGARRSGLKGSKLRAGLALELAAATPTPVVVAPPLDREPSPAAVREHVRA
jgi:nucleotide-binding universal stress UspA family protein